jgi:hypothetical protein
MLASDVIERLYYLDRENLLLNSTAKLSFAPVNPIVDAGQNDLLTNAMPINMKITAVNIRHHLDNFKVVFLKRVYDDNGQEMDPDEPSTVNLMLKIPNAAEANNIQGTWTDWLNHDLEYTDTYVFPGYTTRTEGAGGVKVNNGIHLGYGPHWGNFITPETGLIINNLTFDNIININNGGGRIPFSKKGKKNRSSQKKNRKTKRRTFKKSSQKKNRKRKKSSQKKNRKLKRKNRMRNKKKSRRRRK